MSSTSSYTDTTSSAIEHCESMSALHPDLSPQYSTISSLFTRKLWHQLTIQILDFVSTPQSTLRPTPEGGNSYLSLYDRVVLACDKKMNQLTLARIASAVATSLLKDGGDYVAARAVLENLLEKKTRLGPSPTLYADSKLASLHLAQMELAKVIDDDKLKDIKNMIEKGKRVLQDQVDGGMMDATVVHSSFYEASMTYRKAVGPPEAFYREALLYLNYTPMSNIDSEKRFAISTDVSLAALTGEGVFNFGEVVNHAILECLNDTKNQWLLDLMKVFANGDVFRFQKITAEHEKEIAAQPALLSRAELVKEKITLLALVNMVFERPSAERTLLFQDISDRCAVDLVKVEWLIMRALSLGLIKGSMDQVDQTVTVTWVMPRVLDTNQLKALSARFSEWAVKVSKTRDYMGEQTPTFV